MEQKLGATHRNGERATYRCAACKKLMRLDTALRRRFCPYCDGLGDNLQRVRYVTPEMEAEHETHAEGTG